MSKNKLTLAFDAKAEKKLRANPADNSSRKSSSASRESKQNAILREAAKIFNEQGVGSVSFGDLAARVGVGRATLYHYVADREDLVFQCFQRSCESETERLDIAADEPGGLEQILRYLRESLMPEEQTTVVISDTSFLSPNVRNVISRAQQRNYKRLAHMIGCGVENGTVRPCNEDVIARVLPSIVSFIRMSGRWNDTARGPIDPDGVIDFIEFGGAVDREREFSCTLSVESLSRLKAASFDRESLTEMRTEQILMTGSRLINKHGYDNVSLEDVAKAIGATRGAFYHYFQDKEDLLQRCLERGSDIFEASIDLAEQHGRNGLEKSSIVSHLNTQAQAGALQPVPSWVGLDALPLTQQKKHHQRLRQIVARHDKLAQEGIRDGSRRNQDTNSVVVARAGAYLWIPKWISDVEPTTPIRLADEIVALFNKGLAV